MFKKLIDDIQEYSPKFLVFDHGVRLEVTSLPFETDLDFLAAITTLTRLCAINGFNPYFAHYGHESRTIYANIPNGKKNVS